METLIVFASICSIVNTFFLLVIACLIAGEYAK